MACPAPKKPIAKSPRPRKRKSRSQADQVRLTDLDQKRQLAAKTLTPEVVQLIRAVPLCDVARQLNCSRPTVYSLIRRGELKLLTREGTAGKKPLRISGLVCVTLDSWLAYRSRKGLV